jgi:ADP-ribose pyrophosphatase YjhB (NUDIX family)
LNRKDYYYDKNAPEPKTIVPAVSAVIIDKNNQILLQERVDNGKWSLPGGGMDPGENVEQAIIREVKEETGLNVKVIKLTGIYSDPNHVIAYGDGEVRQQFSICFSCEVTGGTLVTSHESKRVAFVPVSELDSLNMHTTQRIRIRDAQNNKSEAYIR